MKTFLEIEGRQYYTGIILMITLIIALFVSLKKKKQYKSFRLFPIYIFFFLLDVFIFESLPFFHLSKMFFKPFDYVFTFIELIAFSYFFYSVIENNHAKKAIVVFNLIFATFFCYMAFDDEYSFLDISEDTQGKVYTAQAFLLLPMCMYYFFELFKKLPIADLSNEAPFWISTGLLFFMICTLPYSLLESYFITMTDDYNYISNSIFLSFYILLFLMIIRAYLCKPAKAK